MSGFDVMVGPHQSDPRGCEKVIEENRAVQHCEHGTGASARAIAEDHQAPEQSRISNSGSARTTISVEFQVREVWLRFRSFRSLWYVAFLQTWREVAPKSLPPITLERAASIW
jgi:hypothetical protein